MQLMRPIRLYLLVLVAIAMASCGQSQGPVRQQSPAATAQDSADPFGFGPRIAATAKGDLSALISHCRLTTRHVEQSNAFATPCFLQSQGLRLKFTDYLLDSDGRIIAIRGMHPELATAQKLRGLVSDSTTSGLKGHFDRICVRFGHATMPELTIVSKDQCENLVYGLL